DSRWLSKSLKNGSGNIWSLPVFRLSAKESITSVPHCEPGSVTNKRREGRISPEQEAEEMENQFDE
ncbi:hypothetical protein NDU88_003206, partial [Pleurodeles waltl]